MQYRRPQFDSWVGKIHWRKDRLPTPLFLGFLGGSDGKESACNADDLGLIPQNVGKIPWRRVRLPIPVFWPEESRDCIVHGITESGTTERLPLKLNLRN